VTVGAPALLLDLDGTLTDNSTGIARSIAYALDRLGVPVPGEGALRRCMGPPLRESFAWLLDTDDRDAIELAIACYRERFADVGWRENVVYAGIPETLAGLAAGPWRLYLCTSKPELYARRIVQLFGLSEHLHGIYGADMAGKLDDKVRLFAHIAAREGFAPEHGIMVGDRAQDLRAARMNGARAVGVLWGFGSREELAGADAIVAAPEELPAALARLGPRPADPSGG
jgi:phosphoglycolate phosphatase